MFGGSFDPPHQGHQDIVNRALELLDIDKLIILPAFLNPFKRSSLASAKQRLDWCHKLFDSIDRVEVSDYEVSLAEPIYSSVSIKYFQKFYSVDYFIIGADNLESITKWNAFDWINQELTWAIATRKGYQLDTQKLSHWISLDIDMDISSTKIRACNDLKHVDKRISKSVDTIIQNKIRTIMTIDERVEAIVSLLDSKKAEEIEVFNLDKVDYIAQRVVLANSLGGKHTEALYEQLKSTLKPKGEEFLIADVSDYWVVADLGDILIHIMTPEYRQKYSMEDFLSDLAKPTDS